MRLRKGHLLKDRTRTYMDGGKCRGMVGEEKDEMAKPDVSNHPLTTQFISNVLLTIT